MDWPLSLSDVSLWLGVMAIILLITSEFFSSSTGYLKTVVIEWKRLRIIALALGIGFIATVILRVLQVF